MPWDLTGNGGTKPETNYVGTRDSQPLVLKTNGVERARIGASGNVGIGTPTPDAKLTIQADVGAGAFDSRPAQIRIHGSANPNNKLEIGYDTAGNFAVVGAVTEGVAWRNIALANNGGNVGIGTTTPDTKLTVQADVGSGAADSRPAHLRIRSASNPNSKLEIGYDAVGNFGVIAAVTEGVAWRNIVLANNGGNVGIGTTAPQARLHVIGDMIVSGDILLAGADYAEEFDTLEPEKSDPGSVMIVEESGAVRVSDRAYDGRVAGVVSGGGGYRPAVILDHQDAREARRPLALMGKVYCKVDAGYSPIAVGDLLTTSATPGHAMKATDRVKAFGAIIGKALQPLQSGCGLVPILVALQ